MSKAFRPLFIKVVESRYIPTPPRDRVELGFDRVLEIRNFLSLAYPSILTDYNHPAVAIPLLPERPRGEYFRVTSPMFFEFTGANLRVIVTYILIRRYE